MPRRVRRGCHGGCDEDAAEGATRMPRRVRREDAAEVAAKDCPKTCIELCSTQHMHFLLGGIEPQVNHVDSPEIHFWPHTLWDPW